MKKKRRELKTTYIRIRVTQKFKDDLEEVAGKNGMTKYIEDAVEEKIERGVK